jgi:hypothetical protein
LFAQIRLDTLAQKRLARAVYDLAVNARTPLSDTQSTGAGIGELTLARAPRCPKVAFAVPSDRDRGWACAAGREPGGLVPLAQRDASR